MALRIFKDRSDDLSRIPGFNDELASKISWEKAKRGGVNFKTYFAFPENPSQIVFKKSVFLKIAPWIFILAFFVMFYFTNQKSFDYRNFHFNNDDQIAMSIIMLGFLIAGILIIVFSGKHIVFDKRTGYYYKGLKKLGGSFPEEGKNCVHLKKIHAIQILSKVVRTSKNRYRSYELNLVLTDVSRIYVIGHSVKNPIREDAQLISRFLNIPVWDVTRD